MAKRPADSSADDSESVYSSSPKRARTVDSDEEVHAESSNRRKSKAKSKARKRDDDDEEEEGEEDEALGGGEAEDKLFEREHREKILADLASKRKVHGVCRSYLHLRPYHDPHIGHRRTWHH